MFSYVDASAAVKLVAAESETPALRAWIERYDGTLVSCDLLRTEVLRAIRRADPELMPRAREVLDALDLLTPDAQVFEHAAQLEPASLRSLDAVHLAAALSLGDDLEHLVAYDERLADAARAYGVSVVSPA